MLQQIEEVLKSTEIKKRGYTVYLDDEVNTPITGTIGQIT